MEDIQTLPSIWPTMDQTQEIEATFILDYARIVDGEPESYRGTAIKCALARVWMAGRLLGQRETAELYQGKASADGCQRPQTAVPRCSHERG